jgi:hypothetical protein
MSDILRFSRRVPPDAVNLAWIRIPPLSPLVNLSLVETGKYLTENLDLLSRDSAGISVRGVSGTVNGIADYYYLTTYNVTSPLPAAATSSGVAAWSVSRTPTTELSPSGFLVDNLTAEIRVLHPEADGTGIWRLRIKDGVVLRRFSLPAADQSWLRQIFSPGDELMLYYSVPECDRMPFAAESDDLLDARVLDLSGMIAERIDEHTLQLPHPDLWAVRSLTVNGEEQIVHPSGQLFVGTLALSGQGPPRGPFTGWDPDQGRVTLTRSLREEDRLVASYRYREPYCLYEGYRSEDGVYHDLNLNPAIGHTYDNGRPTAELLTQPLYLYLLPTAAYRVTRADGTVEQERKIYSGLQFERQFLRWEKTAASIAAQLEQSGEPTRQRASYGHATYGAARFVSDLTVDTLQSFVASGQTLANLPAALVLAKLYVTPAAGIEGVDLVDARRRGGGVPESLVITDPRLPGATRAELETYWDESGWDGQPVPLPGVLLVELPEELLTGASGYQQFTSEEIETLVRSHIAGGIQVLIRYV